MVIKRERQREKDRERERDRETDRQTDRDRKIKQDSQREKTDRRRQTAINFLNFCSCFVCVYRIPTSWCVCPSLPRSITLGKVKNKQTKGQTERDGQTDAEIDKDRQTETQTDQQTVGDRQTQR